jgi:hypothetical protein
MGHSRAEQTPTYRGYDTWFGASVLFLYSHDYTFADSPFVLL